MIILILMMKETKNNMASRLCTQNRWNNYAKEDGFKDEKEMFSCLLLDHTNQMLSNHFGCSNTLVSIRAKAYGLHHLIRSRGGDNVTACVNLKWEKRAIRLGFKTEKEMLENYKDNYKILFSILQKDIMENEDATLKCVYTVSRRYKKYNIVAMKKRKHRNESSTRKRYEWNLHSQISV